MATISTSVSTSAVPMGHAKTCRVQAEHPDCLSSVQPMSPLVLRAVLHHSSLKSPFPSIILAAGTGAQGTASPVNPVLAACVCFGSLNIPSFSWRHSQAVHISSSSLPLDRSDDAPGCARENSCYPAQEAG